MAQWEAEQSIEVKISQYNLVGNPAMTLPIALMPDSSGVDPGMMLPVGTQNLGPLHGEEQVLKVGYLWQPRIGWRNAWKYKTGRESLALRGLE